MQMINKNRDGVTLIVLAITIIVLIIIISITLNYGLSEIHEVTNKKTESELEIVQEAIMQRYALVESANQLRIVSEPITDNKTAAKTTDEDYETNPEKNRPSGFIGTRIANPQSYLTSQGFTSIELRIPYEIGQSGLLYEEYYYLLNEADLLELGIEKEEDSRISNEIAAKQRIYMVNYLTGEIFDIANKKYYKTDVKDSDPIYTQPTVITMDQRNYEFKDD